MSNAPHYNIDVGDFWADPYPDLARMRKEGPIAFVPQLGSTVFTRRDDLHPGEAHRGVFLAFLDDLPQEPETNLFDAMDAIANELRSNPLHVPDDDKIAFRHCSEPAAPT